MKIKMYLWYTLGIIGFGFIAVFIIAGALFNNTLKDVQKYSRSRMLSAAGYTRDYFTDQIPVNQSTISDSLDRQLNSWLEGFTHNVGFERIVITDTLANVLWSSDNLIVKDDDFNPYLIDEEVFYASILEESFNFSSTVRLEGAYFKSLYFPCIINDKTAVIVIEADQNYFHSAERFSRSVFIFAIFLIAIAVIMVVILITLDRKAQQAFALATRNERLAYLGRTSAELAHELKNPLSIMKSSIDVLRMKYDHEEKEKAFQFLSDELMRVSNMITDILSFSKDKSFVMEQFSPYSLIQESTKTISKEYPTISFDITVSDKVLIKGDRQAFNQITNNIVSNACHAIKSNGTVSIYGNEGKGTFTIYFKDTGPGIDKTIAANIFEPFVTGSKTGTGLGLAIVKSLCEAMNWDIRLHSKKQGDTTFVVEIKEYSWVKS